MPARALLCSSLAAAVLLAPAAPVAGQAALGNPRTKPGQLVIRGDEQRGNAVTDPARRRAAMVTAAKLLAALRRDPAIASPVGYQITLTRSAGKPREGFDVGAAYHVGYEGYVWQYILDDDAHAGQRIIPAARLPVGAFVNTVWCAGDFGDKALDGGPPIVQGSQVTGRLHGYLVYDGDCILITNRGEHPFLPVTRERFLRLKIMAMEKKLAYARRNDAKERAAMPPEMRAQFDSLDLQVDSVVDAWKTDLRGMSAADRVRPVWVRHTAPGDSEMVEPGDARGVPLLSPNPAFFDPRLPPDQPQVIALYIPFAQPGVTPNGIEEDPPRRANMQAIVDGLDWASLAAMVKP